MATLHMLRMDHDRLERAVAPAPPPGYAIRPFRPDDWDACIALMLAAPDPCYRVGPWDRALCERSMRFSAGEELDYPAGRGQLVFHGDDLVAMALASPGGYLNQVYTHPAHRRRGLARAAIGRVLMALHAHGVRRSFLLVFLDNLEARSCYLALGFTVTGPQDVPAP
jgi:ribosomal protein S18 acetylase RimI-like enzyme